MTDNDTLVFKDEETSGIITSETTYGSPWKILIVDDDEDVHSVTIFMLSGQKYRERTFSFLHAYSAEEAKSVLDEHEDIAVILLDVVMESDDSGLLLVKYVREKLRNLAVRIILRTGQAGKAPATRVILEYDIDDYKEKTELTLERMLVCVISALRSYSFITAIEENRNGLKRIIEASADIFERQSLKKLAAEVLRQLAGILQLKKDDMETHVSGLAASAVDGELTVMAASGKFSEFADRPLSQVSGNLVQQALSMAKKQPHAFYCESGTCAWYFRNQDVSEIFLFFEIGKKLDENEQDLLELFFANVSMAFDNLLLNKSIEDTQKEVIFQLAETVEYRSAETGGHVRRVSEYARLLALQSGLGEEEAEMLRLASTAHDLGKIGIPDSILGKPGPLTPDEYEIIKSHVLRGHELLMHSTRPIIQAAARIVLQHHERWDGTGYPQGLSGEDIHLHARIVAVADVFDALSNKRAYHQAWSREEVFTYFQDQRGKQFDPRLVDIMLENKPLFMATCKCYHR